MASEAPNALLSEEESDALFAAMRDGRIPAEPTSLAAPDAPLQRVLKDARALGPELAVTFREAVMRLANATCVVNEPTTAVVSRDERPETVRWELRRDGAPIGVFAISTTFALHLLDRRLGTNELLLTEERQSRPREVSNLDRRMLEPIARSMAELLIEQKLVEGEISIGGDVEPAIATPVLRMTMAVSVGSIEGEVTILLHPAAVLSGELDRVTRDADKRRLAGLLGSVEVELVAVLGRINTSVRELLALEAGAVLRLDAAAERPIVVTCDGIVLMHGMPRAQEGQLAVEITHQRPKLEYRAPILALTDGGHSTSLPSPMGLNPRMDAVAARPMGAAARKVELA